MPRTRPPHRLDQLADAALTVFGTKGFRLAQMDDIAAAMGVAKGTLYGYVDGKEALFALAVESVMRQGPLPGTPLPIAAPTEAQLLAMVSERIAELSVLPALDRALSSPAARDAAGPAGELARVIGELWDLVAATRRGADMVERSARDWPELAEIFYAGFRRDLITRLADYIGQRSARGEFRPAADPGVAARFLLESVTWFARHRLRDPDSPDIGDAAARHVVTCLLVNALIPDTGGCS